MAHLILKKTITGLSVLPSYQNNNRLPSLVRRNPARVRRKPKRYKNRLTIFRYFTNMINCTCMLNIVIFFLSILCTKLKGGGVVDM